MGTIQRPLRTVATAILLGAIGAGLTPDYLAAAEAEDRPACLYQRAEDQLCIRQEAFNADLCRMIGHFAETHGVPSAFFARLIWRESLFRPEAVSPKGAEGIAQFMPNTAKRRGLDNSFDVIDALDASAAYLKALEKRFGNFGFAAAAYNAGENGLGRFLSKGRLPIETRDYVFAITGNIIETWRDAPPVIAAPALDEALPFEVACTNLARTRRMNEPVLAGSADWAPWGVQLAAHYRPSVVDHLFRRAISSLPEPLNAERALIVRQRGGNFGYRTRYAARIGRETRQEATMLCAAIRAAAVPCTVFRNR
ncbi:Lytic transglycosylase catalytic [Rhizobium sp. PDO1-076]|uniref:transglycosylase SLT domain-containing protein n=1 Tax=Rhizobium sp. PDO1-076 TaxID=1125979 RepID=UPI00024E2F4A|nr:lytic transglycosylase domain-containing protein [Rhizobium sp. PDO1-076]EHS49738.1 Lytic transglycosylase catalytic [Rhizobium sp. PDO1-076]